MALRTVLTGLATAAMLLGCCIAPTTPTPTGAAPTAPPVTPPVSPAVAQCGLPATSANTCEPGRPICHIYVFGKADKAYVYPHALEIPRRGRFVIVWHLLDPGAEFRNNADGPGLGHNTEFENGESTDDADGARGVGRPGKRFRMEFKNSLPNRSHQYTIKFKTASGAEAICDPKINNSSN